MAEGLDVGFDEIFTEVCGEARMIAEIYIKHNADLPQNFQNSPVTQWDPEQ